ncbi:hypothetical protein MMC06_005063 [Schaereria dolodes]|nr:hypothetical protein [Schaereria dolodes]
MPVINRRQQSLDLRQVAIDRNSLDSIGAKKEPVWIVAEDFEKPQKEMDFPSAKLRSPTKQRSRQTLRINTIPQNELHERYQSSEEEVSPSPEDYTDNHDKSLEPKATEQAEAEIFDLLSPTTSYPAIARAVPILAVGRPRLIDITNIAPMQRRRRPLHKSYLMSGPKRLTAVNEDMPYFAQEATTLNPSLSEPLPKRKESLAIAQPDSWLPDENTEPLEEENNDHYFPGLGVDLRQAPSYADYDPYSLDPPRLVPSPTHSFNSATHARGGSLTSLIAHTSPRSSLKTGLTRKFSLVKRANGLIAEERPHNQNSGNGFGTKKLKMVARGADEREDVPIIPPFPFEESKAIMA